MQNRTNERNSAEARENLDRQGERLLRLYHLYRCTVGAALVVVIQSGLHLNLLQMVNPSLFHKLSWVYLVGNVLIGLLLPLRTQGLQLFFTALIDIAMLSLLFYEAGGIPSGMGSLLVISVAIANTLVRGRVGLLLAAVASIALIFLTFYLSLERAAPTTHYVQAGTLGLLCFVSALFIQALGRRLEQSESMAQRHAATVAELQGLNALILDRMRTGILAIDADSRILMANPASGILLGQPPMRNEPLCQRFSELADILEDWQKNPALPPRTLRGFSEGPVLQPSFALLQQRNAQNLLIFLEDVSQITQQAQQIKLASLGRLTASIAHEIRNPLGAISHAAQLLQEAEDLSPADQRLTQIILDHSRRMNLIVESILQLSRRRQAEPELLPLCSWLRQFCQSQQSGLPEQGRIELECADDNLQSRFDPEQLTQVLINLIQNGMRYSARRHGQARVCLRLFLEPERQQPALDVLDDGDGIAPEVADNLFEPFFTTESKGTGLGLYISRELCQANRARLDYIPQQQDGACFRLTFAHPSTAS